MKTTGKSLAFVGIGAIACMLLGASPAHAQAFSFGYSGPGVSVGVQTGNYGLLRRHGLLHRRISSSGAREHLSPVRWHPPTYAHPLSWAARSSSLAPMS